jgi:hypothetical protein
MAIFGKEQILIIAGKKHILILVILVLIYAGV